MKSSFKSLKLLEIRKGIRNYGNKTGWSTNININRSADAYILTSIPTFKRNLLNFFLNLNCILMGLLIVTTFYKT